MRKHMITLETAIEMTTLYRQKKETILANEFKGQDILPLSETVDRAAIDTLLNHPGCTSLRIYYGMSSDNKIHAILVGVNSENEDLLPGPVSSAESDEEPVIVDETLRCPPFCPKNSPLNQ